MFLKLIGSVIWSTWTIVGVVVTFAGMTSVAVVMCACGKSIASCVSLSATDVSTKLPVVATVKVVWPSPDETLTGVPAKPVFSFARPTVFAGSDGGPGWTIVSVVFTFLSATIFWT